VCEIEPSILYSCEERLKDVQGRVEVLSVSAHAEGGSSVLVLCTCNHIMHDASRKEWENKAAELESIDQMNLSQTVVTPSRFKQKHYTVFDVLQRKLSQTALTSSSTEPKH